MFLYVSVLLEAKLNDPNKDIYTVIKKVKKKKKGNLMHFEIKC